MDTGYCLTIYTAHLILFNLFNILKLKFKYHIFFCSIKIQYNFCNLVFLQVVKLANILFYYSTNVSLINIFLFKSKILFPLVKRQQIFFYNLWSESDAAIPRRVVFIHSIYQYQSEPRSLTVIEDCQEAQLAQWKYNGCERIWMTSEKNSHDTTFKGWLFKGTVSRDWDRL